MTLSEIVLRRTTARGAADLKDRLPPPAWCVTVKTAMTRENTSESGLARNARPIAIDASVNQRIRAVLEYRKQARTSSRPRKVRSPVSIPINDQKASG